MKKTLLCILLSMTFSNAEAASKNKTTTSNIKSETYPTYSSNQFFKTMNYEARPGAGVVAGYFTLGANLESKYGFKFGSNTLFVGFETGFFRTGIYSDTFQTISITSIPLTPSVSFEFPISSKVKLYSGTSIGVTIATGHNSVSDATGNSNSASSTSGYFSWKLRPGVVVADQFVAELPIGTTDGNFYFMPNVGMRF